MNLFLCGCRVAGLFRGTFCNRPTLRGAVERARLSQRLAMGEVIQDLSHEAANSKERSSRKLHLAGNDIVGSFRKSKEKLIGSRSPKKGVKGAAPVAAISTWNCYRLLGSHGSANKTSIAFPYTFLGQAAQSRTGICKSVFRRKDTPRWALA